MLWRNTHAYPPGARNGATNESNKALIVRDNTLINLQTIEAARQNAVQRLLYTSSACVYPGYLQKAPR